MIALRRGLAGLALLLGLLVGTAAPAQTRAPTLPPLTGRVVDQANVLSPEAEARITQEAEALERATGRQFVVVTLSSLQGYDIERFGLELLRGWGIGRRQQDDGAVFVIAPSERKVRVEVGAGLEPVLTDALSSVILQRAVLPQFRTGNIEGGIVAGADAIAQQLTVPAGEAAAANARAAPKEEGGGMNGFIVLLIVGFILFLIIRAVMGGGRGSGGGGIAPIVIGSVLANAGRRDWGGGDDWGGGGGGGGGTPPFSGGGGWGIGGGASGSW